MLELLTALTSFLGVLLLGMVALDDSPRPAQLGRGRSADASRADSGRASLTARHAPTPAPEPTVAPKAPPATKKKQATRAPAAPKAPVASSTGPALAALIDPEELRRQIDKQGLVQTIRDLMHQSGLSLEQVAAWVQQQRASKGGS
jgi:hypothetical protein